MKRILIIMLLFCGVAAAQMGTTTYTGTITKDISSPVPTLSTGPTNYATGQVQLLPGANQVISQPSGTTLGINSLNGVLYANAFSGTNVAAQINAAIAACGSGACVVQVPPTMGAGFWTNPLPANVTVLDYRLNGLNIFSNTSNAPAGRSCGIAIYTNGITFPPINPQVPSCVGIYAEVGTDSHQSAIWGMNTVVQIYPGMVADGLNELDIGNWGVNITDPFSSSPGKTQGLAIVTGGSVPSTVAMSTTSANGAGGWNHGIVLNGLLQDALIFRTFMAAFGTGASITGSATPQVVPVTAPSDLFVGKTYSVDTGANQEDVLLTAVNTATPSVTGVFLKSHASGVTAWEYTAANGFDFSHAIFTGSHFLVADLQAYFNSGTRHVPAFAIKDTSGVVRAWWQWDTSNISYLYDIGGGIHFKTLSGADTLVIQPNGLASLPALTTANAVRYGSDQDFNAITACGLFDSNNVVNGPAALGTAFIKLQVICSGDTSGVGGSDNFVTQIAYDEAGGTNVSYIRNKTSGTWGAWQVMGPLAASLTTTSSTSDTVAITGMTSSGHCSLAPTNSSAATNVATTYISAKATNAVTVTHAATAAMTFDLVCVAY